MNCSKRYLAHFTETELIENLLHELPALESSSSENLQRPDWDDIFEGSLLAQDEDDAEQARLLPGQRKVTKSPIAEDQPILAFVGLNALEIAAIANAKKFLSQRVVQKLVVSFSISLIPSPAIILIILIIITVFQMAYSSHCLDCKYLTRNMDADSRDF